jgi:hypothetical protein
LNRLGYIEGKNLIVERISSLVGKTAPKRSLARLLTAVPI